MKYSIPVIQQKLKKADEEIINLCILINSISYFIEYAFIIANKDRYRLIALRRGRILINKTYGTAKGAKVAFARIYNPKSWEKGIKPDWSHFYNPDKKWFQEKTKDFA